MKTHKFPFFDTISTNVCTIVVPFLYWLAFVTALSPYEKGSMPSEDSQLVGWIDPNVAYSGVSKSGTLPHPAGVAH